MDKSIIRIKSAHKWPERTIIDTSLPTIVPAPAPVLASAPVIDRPREAFAQLDAPSQQVLRNPSPAPASFKYRSVKKVAHTKVAAYREPSAAWPRENLPAGW